MSIQANLTRILSSPKEFHARAVQEFSKINKEEEKRLAEAYNATKRGMETGDSFVNATRNPEKNRYGDVLPYDKNRIKLTSSNDYINASFITSPNGRRWIAPQGPLPSTVIDFWQMVVDQGCTSIVMLTKAVENGRTKCHTYWPSKEILTGPGWSVLPLESTTNSNLAIRHFDIKTSDNVRRVTQYHYLGWPDHGVPESPSPLLQILSMIKSDPNPVIVHCSAGVGRTGTLISLDALLSHDSWTDSLIYDTVTHYRRQRTLMVQSFDQYRFLYAALLEGISKK